MAKHIETIWEYLESKGFPNTPRTSKKTVHLVLEHEKLNAAQKKRMAHLWEASEKLDGVYSLVTLIPDGNFYEVRHWGRSGKALENCEELDFELRHNLPKLCTLTPKILISEITADGPLAKLSGYLTPSRVKESVFEPQNFRDNFHDILDVEEFIDGESAMTYAYRAVALERFLGLQGNIIPSTQMTLEEAKDFAEKTIFPKGGEGLVCRDVHKLWVAGKRDESVIKIKEKLSYDVTVVGLCSGKEGSKYEHTLGKLLVSFRAFGKPLAGSLVVPISGMSDAQRDLWWEDPSLIIGATVKMDAKSFTENGNLREPRYKETRHDKASDFPVRLLGGTVETYKGKCKIINYKHEVLL